MDAVLLKAIEQDDPLQIMNGGGYKSYFYILPKVTNQMRFRGMKGGEWPTFTVWYARYEDGEFHRQCVRRLDPQDENDARQIYKHTRKETR